MARLTVKNLSKSYGDVQALEEVSFEVPDGEFVVVLGISGAGKSTLLRCLNGLTQPTSGSIRLNGERIAPADDDIGMIFQQHNIVGGMSAYRNALTGTLSEVGNLRSLFGTVGRERKLRALEALDTVGLLAEADQSALSMSGGQQQRVGIARALVQQPDLLLADEPVASLDPASAETVMGYLREAAEERGLTALASLHQVNIARKFGQRFVGLRDGQKVFDGYTEDLTVDVIDEIYGDVETAAIREGDEEPTPDSTETTTDTTGAGAGVES
ncbi:MAG: phosphonate ABC transporter ATP-binding protein [Halobaculum sp.]